MDEKSTAHYHLPGLFEFYDLYRLFLPLYEAHREYFYGWCDIGSLYGAPSDCLWGGGRVSESICKPRDAVSLARKYGISSRLTFSNSLLRPEHLSDSRCNELCALLSEDKPLCNGVIVHSELLTAYLQTQYPKLYLVSSTTKVLTTFTEYLREAERPEFRYIVPDFRLNKAFDRLNALPQPLKDKTEFLCNECCSFSCTERKRCYEAVSRKNLGEDAPEHRCTAPHAQDGYRLSQAMRNPAFISIEDIQRLYLPMGFTEFKLEGRGLGSAMVFEILLYYMVRPEHQLEVREAIYLDSMLDLF